MKNQFIFFNLLIINLSMSSLVLSQTEKGQFLIGGQYSLNFSSNSSTVKGSNNSYVSGKTRSLQLAPQVGYFVIRNGSLGLEFRYNFEKEIGQAIQGADNYNYTRSYSFVPFVRYYIGRGRIKPYLHADIGPGWRKTGMKNTIMAEFTQKSKLLFYELRGGLGIFVNKYISFDIGIGYESTTIFYSQPLVNGTQDKWKVLQNGLGSTIGLVVCL
jgi:hypothetical protein